MLVGNWGHVRMLPPGGSPVVAWSGENAKQTTLPLPYELMRMDGPHGNIPRIRPFRAFETLPLSYRSVRPHQLTEDTPLTQISHHGRKTDTLRLAG